MWGLHFLVGHIKAGRMALQLQAAHARKLKAFIINEVFV
jgi:hypothetical protein